MKTRTSILIETEILKQAQEYGINISKACENSLILLINAIKGANTQISGMGARLIISNGNQTVSMPSLNGVQNGIGDLEVAGSNPAPGISEIDWEAFERWLRKDKNPNVVQYVLSYAKRYLHCLTSMDLSSIANESVSKRRLIMASLSNLAKFLGIYDQWKQTVHKFGIKWVTMDVKDKRIIDRLVRKANPDVVYGWVREVKAKHPEYSNFMDFVAITGIRLNEAIESWNLIKTVDNLNDYYDSEKEMLMHYKYPEKFMRKGKKVFISFAPKSMIEKIRNSYQIPISSRHVIRHTLEGLGTRFSDLREAYASLITKYLNQTEIDFIQGRVGTSVFMQNYFNPALISDLKERVFKGIAEIQSKI